MKTSVILFLLSIAVALTGMVSYNLLLKKEYDKIDWSNPYQFYKPQPIRAASHLVLNGNPNHEFLVEYSPTASLLVRPEDAYALRYHQTDDTLFIDYKPIERYTIKPKNMTSHSFPVRILLRLPDLKQIKASRAHLVVQNFNVDSLTVDTNFTRLTLFNVRVSNSATISLRKESYLEFGAGSYQQMGMRVYDASGFDLHDAQIKQFNPVISDQTEVRLSGQALKWLGWKRL